MTKPDDWRAQVLRTLPKMEAAEPATGFQPGPTTTITAQAPFSAGVHTVPSFDPIEFLPEGAQDRLRKLRLRRDDAYAVTISHSELQALTVELQQAEQRLTRLQAYQQNGGFGLGDDDGRVIEQRRLVNKLTDDLQRLRERAEARAQVWQTAGGAVTACEDWLRHGVPSGVQLLDYDGLPEPVLLKGEKGLIDAIENRRRRVSRNQSLNPYHPEQPLPDFVLQASRARTGRASGAARRGPRQPVGRA